MEGASEEVETKKKLGMISRPPTSLCNQPYPWLVIRDGENWERQTFYSVTEDISYVRSIPELQNKYIATSCEGWLVLADNDTHECVLLNILTMHKVQLPSAYVANYRRCVLSSQNIDASCRVLFFNSSRNRFKSCHIGDREFVERDLLIDYDYEGYLFMAAITFEGKLYVTTTKHDLLCADFADPVLNFTTVIRGHGITELQQFPFKQTRHYLAKSFGELLLIYKTGCDHEVYDLKIYSADLSCKKWIPLEDLGDRAIFLDAANCFVASPASVYGLKGNSVYYVNKFGRNLSMYNVEDESITIFGPCHSDISYDSALSWVSINSASLASL